MDTKAVDVKRMKMISSSTSSTWRTPSVQSALDETQLQLHVDDIILVVSLGPRETRESRLACILYTAEAYLE